MESNELKSYPGQAEGEITQTIVYKHFMAVAPIFAAMFIVALVAIAGVVLYNIYTSSSQNSAFTGIASIAGFLVFATIVLLCIATFWIWRRNKIIITNQHIVDVDQLGLFNRKIAALRLTEIQDISASVRGPMQIVLKYGTIIIQTAGERENFVFDFVPNPYELVHYIIETRKKFTSKSGH